MNILIFKTVNDDRTKRLLNSIDTAKNSVYMLMPKSEIDIYNGLGLNIHYIGTNGKYIDYETVMEEDQIPDIKYHEIWVLSPDYSNIYTYWKVYFVISELKYCKVYYKEINKDKIVTYDLTKEAIFSRTYDLTVRIVEKYMDLLYWFEKRIKGCK